MQYSSKKTVVEMLRLDNARRLIHKLKSRVSSQKEIGIE